MHDLTQLPVFHAEWVLWLLLGLSVVSITIILERTSFFIRRRTNLPRIHAELVELLGARRLDLAQDLLQGSDSFETRVAHAGLGALAKGVEAAGHAMEGEAAVQRLRFGRGLGFLATVGSNAPFIGLFGTVLGIIDAFRALSHDLASASTSVMGGIAEALIATAVGLLVAIPAVLAFNTFSGQLTNLQSRSRQLESAILIGLSEEERV